MSLHQKMLWHFNLIFYPTLIIASLAVEYTKSSVPHNDCPIIDDVNHAVMLPFPEDCNKYYSCLKGQAYLQQCPNNLHWSSLTYRCDYPDVAKCQAKSTDPITIGAAKPHTLPAALTNEIIYQLHPNDCTKFYKCQVLQCPVNYYWNAFTQNCDFPHKAHCSLKNTNRQLAAGIAESIAEANLTEDIFTLSYPQDCAKFYQCQTMLCAANYNWNALKQQCDLPHLAKCPWQTPETSWSTLVPTAYTAPPTLGMITQSIENVTVACADCVQQCDGNLHHYLPHPFDCHKFIQCNGWSFIHTCPDNLFWNAKLNTCDRICIAN